MKKGIVILMLLLLATGAKGIGIKLYIGSVEIVTKDYKAAHYLQLVVCNNTMDTVYIPRHHLEHVQPSLTSDVSMLTDGGAFLMLSNVPGMINDMAVVGNDLKEPPRFLPPPVTELDKARKEKNNLLPGRKFAETDCFVFAPGSCLTINSLMLSFPGGFLRLEKVNELQQQQMETNLVMPVEYYSNRNATGRNVILISRSSEDLKSIVLEAAGKK